MLSLAYSSAPNVVITLGTSFVLTAPLVTNYALTVRERIAELVGFTAGTSACNITLRVVAYASVLLTVSALDVRLLYKLVTSGTIRLLALRAILAYVVYHMSEIAGSVEYEITFSAVEMLFRAYTLVRIDLHFVRVSFILGILGARAAADTALLTQSASLTLCLYIERKITFLTVVNANTAGFTISAEITRNVGSCRTFATGTSRITFTAVITKSASCTSVNAVIRFRASIALEGTEAAIHTACTEHTKFIFREYILASVTVSVIV